jgi:hypothetical protein
MTSLEGWGSTIELHPHWSSVTWSSPSLHQATESRCRTRTRRAPNADHRIARASCCRNKRAYDLLAAHGTVAARPRQFGIPVAFRHIVSSARPPRLGHLISAPYRAMTARACRLGPMGRKTWANSADLALFVTHGRGTFREHDDAASARPCNSSERCAAQGERGGGWPASEKELSGRQDSNLRSSAPKADALATTLRPGSVPHRSSIESAVRLRRSPLSVGERPRRHNAAGPG